MRKFFLLLIATIFIGISGLRAQEINTSSNYTTALGIKFYPGAISIKHFTTDNIALEGLGSFWSYGFRLTGLYEFHHDINTVPGLKWYVGPGVHIGFYGTGYYGGGTALGIDGVLGLDYKFEGAPINASIDWQPSFEFGSYYGFAGNWGGLGIRYTF